MSPSINTIQPEIKSLDFYQALKEIMNGKRITKEEWENTGEYGILLNEYLCIHREDKDHRWVLSLADIEGLDYQVLEDK